MQSDVQAKQNKSHVAIANVSSTQAMPNHAERKIVRQKPVQTSAVNQSNVQSQRNKANVKVATVHDTAQMPVQLSICNN